MIEAISPIDGRYASKTKELAPYFSEYALIRYRVKVEILYFIELAEKGISTLGDIPTDKLEKLHTIVDNFSVEDAKRIKEIERTTNHDVKAVEYFIKEEFDKLDLSEYKEFIHFGLTSQDINNTANPMMIRDATEMVILESLEDLLEDLQEGIDSYMQTPMLARTHGQPASPTSMSKELLVFMERLENQIDLVYNNEYFGKFGGATGNFNAHYVAYPDIAWEEFADSFLEQKLGIYRHYFTTQIAHYDDLAGLLHNLSRINTILIDFCRDIWTYISMDYFKQKVVANEVGSSAMPHKVNPIDFENAEGNLGIANAIFGHLAGKLPISRLQRDLTDSTVMRNVGVPYAHMLIAIKSIQKGMSKLLLNKDKIAQDLEDNWAVVAEAIQNILRREGYPKPYEALKALTRGQDGINKDSIRDFIETLDVSEEVKSELKDITPFNYLGNARGL